MQIECENCRRVLSYSGARPSFCAYCGRPLSVIGLVTQDEPPTDIECLLNLTGSMPGGEETVDYRPPPTEEGSPRPTQEEFPDRIGGYRLVKRLGSGGMGTVFEAEDESQGRRVALKLISRAYLSSEEAVQRFRREGKLASSVTHPRCVFVLGVDEDRGRPYIIMELMPGATLQHLVDQRGPLNQATAIARILDVIEGLQEFHTQGMIHRDVKPSNCFLDAEGRVKIGDFGLSKSLEGDVNLTRSGTFIGTPLYASPEQIKRDQLDERTDVYSVAATLYFLLTGHPPVQARDAAEALARIVSEPPPPLRLYRSDLPRGLEAVILHGLERDQSRRYRNLQEFHDALMPFLPERPSIGGVGRRIGAYLVDVLLFEFGKWTIFGLGLLAHHGNLVQTYRSFQSYRGPLAWSERITWVLYFTIAEGLRGASIGKLALSLRVERAKGSTSSGLTRGFLRIFVFFGLVSLIGDLYGDYGPVGDDAPQQLLIFSNEMLMSAIGLLTLASTMRRSNGFRGLHEWLSGTRVVRVVRSRPRQSGRVRRLAGDSRLEELARTPAPQPFPQLGPFNVRGAFRWDPDSKVLLGQDSTLERPVWIVLRPSGSPAPSAARRDLDRLARPRWIAGGEHEDGRWDALTAPAGCPLTILTSSGKLTWRDLLPIIRDLTRELSASLLDGTFPTHLSLDQVWILSDGRVQIVDSLEEEAEMRAVKLSDTGPQAGSPESADPWASTGEIRPDPRERQALEFLCKVARTCLEGRPLTWRIPWERIVRPGSRLVPLSASDASEHASCADGRRIRAAVPQRAGVILERLSGVRSPYQGLATFSADLDAAAHWPTEVTRLRRGVHLAIQTFFLLPALSFVVLLSYPMIAPRTLPMDLELLPAAPLLCVAGAALLRGGLSLPLAGLTPVHADGTAAARLACGWRALMAWGPFTATMGLSRFVQERLPEQVVLYWSLWTGGLCLLVLYVLLALVFPSRGLTERLSGIELVPS